MISFHIQILGMCDKSLPNSLGDLRVGIVSYPAIQYYHDMCQSTIHKGFCL